ncbi:MAG: class A beta-lactamase-related serine hydrolase [Deltaproteobacteria bacterium]|nr:MAG: class A beta-lactamase-related serine hydrolase [Deltaproteobacteria bacterium]
MSMFSRTKRFSLGALVFFLLLLGGKTSEAQTTSTPLSESALRAFAKREIPRLMKKFNIVGSTASIVWRGKPVLVEGYGYSDLSKKQKVDPHRTLFRAGSVSKMFTWTAVMQLVEQGKIDLNENIQTYLKGVKLPTPYKQPITMLHLMAHTPGFEDKVLGLFSLAPTPPRTLNSVAMDVLKRVRPPGQTVAYSNYGASLAGYIVECVSGMSFDDYVEKHIFRPLKMTYASFRQLPPNKLRQHLSEGYVYQAKNKTHQRKPFEVIHGAPAGSLSVSAGSIVPYMLAHLHQGKVGEVRLLKPSTIQQMHQTHSRMSQDANGMAHGLIEFQQSHPRVIGHAGDTIFFHSLLMLVPEHQLGLFLSSNTSTGMSFTLAFWASFRDHFFKAKKGSEWPQQFPGKHRNLDEFVGSYRTARRSETDLTKMMSLGMAVWVKTSAQGGLDIFNFFAGKYVRHVEVKPDVFQEADGPNRFVFYRDKKGRIAGLMMNMFPIMSFLPTPWYETLSFNVLLLGLAALFLLLGFIFRPTGLLMVFPKQHWGNGAERAAGFAGFFLVFSYLLILGALVVTTGEDVIFAPPHVAWLRILYIPILLSAVMAVFVAMAWKQSYWTFWGRLHYTLLTLTSLGFAWFLLFWNVCP